MKNDELQQLVNGYVGGETVDMNVLFHGISIACVQIAKTLIHKHGAVRLNAYDIAQDVCMKLLNGGLLKYNPAKGSFSAWLYWVVQNEFVTCTRKRAFKNEESYDGWDTEVRDTRLNEIESMLTDESDSEELFKEVMEKMDVLTDLEREVLTKTQLEGMSMKEMGAEYDKDGNWASGVKLRAAKKIRKALGGRGSGE